MKMIFKVKQKEKGNWERNNVQELTHFLLATFEVVCVLHVDFIAVIAVRIISQIEEKL
jgi:hypothetical protein